VTTRSNLSEARKWIDEHLQPLIRKSIPTGIDPPALLPHRLDKPVYTVSSQTYADILKRQFSLTSTTTSTTATQNQPSRKRQATILDYEMDPQSEYPPLATNKAPSHATPTPVDYAADLTALKQDLQSLRTLITTAVTQLKTEIASLHVTPVSHAMETDSDHPTDQTPEIQELIADLKHDIATIAIEMRTKFAQIADLQSDIALIKSHPLFCNLRSINQQHPMT